MSRTVILMVYQEKDSDNDWRDQEVRHWEEWQTGLREIGIEPDAFIEDVKAAGARIEMLELTLHEPSAETDVKIQRECMVRHPSNPMAFYEDPTLQPLSMYLNYVQSWSRPEKITESTWKKFSSLLHPMITEAIDRHCRPSKYKIPANFTNAWNRARAATSKES